MFERHKRANKTARAHAFRLFLLGLLIAVVASGCSRKELTEARAKEMAQTRIQEKIAGIGLLLFRGTGVDKLISENKQGASAKTTRDDYLDGHWPQGTPGAALQRLLKAGFVDRIETSVVRVPNLTGSYQATYFNGSTFLATLRMQQRSPSLSGTVSGPGTCTWQISGTVSVDRVILKFSSPTGSVPNRYFPQSECWTYLPGDPSGAVPRQLIIKRDGGTTLLTQTDRTVYASGGPMDLRGRTESADITWPIYAYVLKPSFSSQLTTDGRLKVGRVEIVEVNHLLLGPTETMAQAKFNWRIELTPAAQALIDGPKAEGVGELTFGKKPDGDWIVTDMSPNFGELTLNLKAPQAAQGQQTQEPPVPPLTARVTDLTSTLSPDQRAVLEQKLASFESRNGAQIAVLIVPTTQPETIDQYANRVFNTWKLGRKGVNDGVLLLVAKNDRKLRIEVGYGLEVVLNNATAKRIIDEIIAPKFRSGDFFSGITEGAEKIIARLEGKDVASSN